MSVTAKLTNRVYFVKSDAMPRKPVATRERILRAAFARFSSYGFRRTSMEDIAGEAEVSRAALYLQFANKEEIFRSLSQDLHEESLTRAAAALDGEGPLAERLRAGFEAKSLRFVEIAGSPHGGELLDESNRLCGDLVAASERRVHELLLRVLRRAAESGEIDLGAVDLGPAEAAHLLMRATSGLKAAGVTSEDYRTRLAALVRVFSAGIAGRKRSPVRRRRPPASAARHRGGSRTKAAPPRRGGPR